MRRLALVVIVVLTVVAFGCEGEETGPPVLTATATARPSPSATLRPSPSATVTHTPTAVASPEQTVEGQSTAVATATATLGPTTATPYLYPTPYVSPTPHVTPTPLPDPRRTVEGTGPPSSCFPSSSNPSEAALDLGEPTRYSRGIYSIGLDGGGATLLAENPGPGPVPPGPSDRSVSFDQQGGHAVFLADRSKLFLSELSASTPPRLLAEFRYVSSFALAPDGGSLVVNGGRADVDDGLFLVNTSDGSVEVIPVPFQSADDLGWSVAGDRLAAAGISREGWDPGVYIFGPDGSNLIEVAQDQRALAWSPDGSRLALGGEGIYLADVEGWVRKVSESSVRWGTTLSWSPDGRCLAFATVGPQWEDPPSIRVLDVETGWETFLTRDASAPAWSPDGSRIAFLRDGNLWVMNGDGSQQTRLSNPRQPFVQEPFWLPDSSRLLFTYVPPLPESVYVIDFDGTNKVNLADGNGPVWSPDGGRIAFFGGGILGGLGGLVDIYVMESDGRGPIKVADAEYTDAIGPCTRNGSDILWSSDGRFLAYGGNAHGTEVAPSDGSASETQVGGSGASWASGDHRLAYSSCRYEGGDEPAFVVTILDLDSGRTTALAEGEWPSWSPDGARIAFLRDNAVQVMNADGTGEQTLFSLGDDGGDWWGPVDLVWSPDGTRLAVGANSLFVVDVTSGESRRIDENARGPAWSPDGTLLAFSAWDDPNDSDTSRIYIVNADGSGEPRILTDGSDPSWSPDGSRIAFSR